MIELSRQGVAVELATVDLMLWGGGRQCGDWRSMRYADHKPEHDRKPKRCKLLDSKLTDAWHYHENAGIDVVVCTKFGSSILRIPAASLRKWSKLDDERAASRGKGEA